MFTSLFLDLSSQCNGTDERDEGVAFLKAAKSLYGLEGICYMAFNLPHTGPEGGYIHCLYSDRSIRLRKSNAPIPVNKIASFGLVDSPVVNWRNSERLRIELDLRYCSKVTVVDPVQGTSFLLTPSHDETVLFGISMRTSCAKWDKAIDVSLPEIRILANYFHSHILRLNGNDAAEEMLVSARELDCLKWTAAGKTAWEASVILGISERTVRFHLNSAREKMNCATTTQAVAKAVSKQMIAL